MGPPFHVLATIFFVGVCGIVLLLPSLEILIRRAIRIARSEIAVGQVVRWDGPPPNEYPIDPEALLYTPFVRYVSKDGLETVAQVAPPFRRVMTTHYPVGATFGFRYLPDDPEVGFDAEWNQTYQTAAMRAGLGAVLLFLALGMLAIL
jgi:hypothetical protein